MSTKSEDRLSRTWRRHKPAEALWRPAAALFALGLCVLGALPAQAISCAEAARTAEQTWDLPPGLLLAIGDVESGLTPYALNVEGRPEHPGSMADAIMAVRNHQAAGITSIDVGCFQVNLRWHPNAFSVLEQAFDPSANALYAARYLSELYGQSGSWTNAVGLYHSANPGFQDAYRGQVIARIRAMRNGVALDGGDGARSNSPSPIPPAGSLAGLQTDMRLARAASAFIDSPATSIGRAMRIDANLPSGPKVARERQMIDIAYPARRVQ